MYPWVQTQNSSSYKHSNWENVLFQEALPMKTAFNLVTTWCITKLPDQLRIKTSFYLL